MCFVCLPLYCFSWIGFVVVIRLGCDGNICDLCWEWSWLLSGEVVQWFSAESDDCMMKNIVLRMFKTNLFKYKLFLANLKDYFLSIYILLIHCRRLANTYLKNKVKWRRIIELSTPLEFLVIQYEIFEINFLIVSKSNSSMFRFVLSHSSIFSLK